MAGLRDADIRLDGEWRLTLAANGDAPVASGFDCIMQDIRLEAVTQEGDLFYDSAWGWSLPDFIGSEDDPLTVIEVRQRVKSKLERRDVIDTDTIAVEAVFKGDILTVFASFRFVNDNEERTVSVSVDRINVEVTSE